MFINHSWIPVIKIVSLISLSVFSIGNKSHESPISHCHQTFQRITATNVHTMSVKEYTDKVHAIWLGQMVGAMMGWPFEHKPASTQWIENLPQKFHSVPVDDDWYYEMVAIRAFEKYGINMSVKDLGKQWTENNAGTWGSSEQALRLLQKGVIPPATGHPRYNKL